MPFPEHAVIAAAGLGSRLGRGMPKCLIEIGGRPLIQYQLALLAGVRDVRLVVGYMEEEVIETVRRIRPDVLFVRNPRFRETTTQDSYALGARYLVAPCLFLDADILFEPAAFGRFLDLAARHPLTVGLTAAKTEFAVYAHTRTIDDELHVVSFSTSEAAPLEWANIVCAPAGTFSEGRGAVYERLAELLPAAACEVVSYEVDTQADLAKAKAYWTATGARA